MFKTDGVTCPFCGSFNDGAAPVNTTGPPPPGSIGICFYCIGVFVYTGTGAEPFPEDQWNDTVREARQKIVDFTISKSKEI